MKHKLFFTLLSTLFISFSFGQKKYELSGVITDCNTKAPIEGVVIKLLGSDNTSIETKSNASGYYKFENCFILNTNYIVTTLVNNNAGASEEIKYGLCPYGYRENNGYLNTSEKVKFTITDSTKENICANFCLQKILVCEINFPTICFQKNTTNFLIPNCDKIQLADTALDCFVSFLIANKTFRMGIDGHADSKEKNREALSLERAKKVYELLIQKGIDKRRLYYKGYADKQPNKEWNKEKFAYIKTGNCSRVVFSIVSKDFELPPQNNNRTPLKKMEEEDE